MDRYECLAILQDTLAIPGLVFVGRVGVRAQEVCGVELSRPANEVRQDDSYGKRSVA
jgi:hypothetical protein